MRTRHIYTPLLAVMLLGGCYSFKGGSAPAYLNTISIPPAEDVSGFFKATIRDDLRRELVRKFREDNSLRVVDDPNADSRLNVTITGIRNNERRNVNTNELETVRGVVVEARVTLDDNVKRRPLFKDKTFRAEESYPISQGSAGEDDAFRRAIDRLSTDILLESVAGW